MHEKIISLHAGQGLPTPHKDKTADFPKRPARVGLRSGNNANSNNGVSYMNANNDSSNTNAWYGSRLALISVKPEKIFCPPAWRRVAGAVAGD